MYLFITHRNISFAVFLLIILGFILGCYQQYQTINTAVITNKEIKAELTYLLQDIFASRNKALLNLDYNLLGNLYNKKVRNGLWAYEHEVKKMKYLHKWSEKQGVKFQSITPDIVLRYAKKKGDGYNINLLVSTEYKYIYQDSTNTVNSFRIGTYHSLDLMPEKEELLITREWYTDPFADSLQLDKIKNDECQKFILNQKPRDFSGLNTRRINAVKYADQYCGAASLPEYDYKYNHEYRNYNHLGGDCANFASQILHEGANFSKNYTWNYVKNSGSKAWVNARSFNYYMTYSGRATLLIRGTYNQVLKQSYQLLPGDYIAYEKKGKVVHISVITAQDSRGYMLVNSHNTDRYRVPWDLGWSNKGIKFRLVRVHY